MRIRNSRRRPGQAPRPVPPERDAADRGGARLRGLLGERVDPLPPVLALPRRARSATSQPIVRDEWVPETHVHRLTDTNPVEPGGDWLTGAPAPAVQQRHRGLDLQADRRARRLLPQRRGRRGPLHPPRHRHRRDDLRRRPLPAARLRRDPARDHVPGADGLTRRPGLAVLPHAGRDRDPEPLPQPLRAAARARAVLAARLPPAGRAPHAHRPRRLRADGPGPRRLPGLPARLPPVRRRRLGRLRLPVHVQHGRLRADHRPHPHAAAGPPDVPGPELRDLLVLPARARLRPAGDRAARTTTRTCSPRRRSTTSTASSASRKGVDVGMITLHPSRPAARAAAGAGRGLARRQAHRGAGGDVGHVQAAAS